MGKPAPIPNHVRSYVHGITEVYSYAYGVFCGRVREGDLLQKRALPVFLALLDAARRWPEPCEGGRRQNFITVSGLAQQAELI
jgi:hypothetical protein